MDYRHIKVEGAHESNWWVCLLWAFRRVFLRRLPLVKRPSDKKKHFGQKEKQESGPKVEILVTLCIQKQRNTNISWVEYCPLKSMSAQNPRL
jgi:hypothetical protein